jgi:hypothetical protein
LGEAVAGAVEAGVDGGFGESEEFGDFGDGVFFEVVEDDEFAVFVGELAEGGADVLSEVGGFCRVGRAAQRAVAKREVVAFPPFSAFGAAAADGDGGEPGFDGAFVAEFGVLAEGGEKDVLDDVVGVAAPVEEAADGASDVGLVVCDEIGEESEVI